MFLEKGEISNFSVSLLSVHKGEAEECGPLKNCPYLFLNLHYSVSRTKCICFLDLDLCGQYFSQVLGGCSLELVLDVYRILWTTELKTKKKRGGRGSLEYTLSVGMVLFSSISSLYVVLSKKMHSY